MKKILLLLVLVSGFANAQWKAYTIVDEFTDEISIVPYVTGEGNDWPYNSPIIAYYRIDNTLAILDGGAWVADVVRLTIRVDKNGVMNEVTRDISKDNDTFWFRLNDKLLAEMKMGNKLLIKADTDYGSHTMKFTLLGFTKAYNKKH